MMMSNGCMMMLMSQAVGPVPSDTVVTRAESVPGNFLPALPVCVCVRVFFGANFAIFWLEPGGRRYP